MLMRTLSLIISSLALAACASDRPAPPAGAAEAGAVRVSAPEPLVMGESFTIESRIMGEARRLNVFLPTVYGQRIDNPLPVLYMLDGGVDEDFLHIAGLVQILVSDGSMRPFLLVGIKNTSRRRDLTGPTSSAEDQKIAPVVGGSAAFRRFVKEEAMPAVKARYRTTDEAAIIGESLAGLFVLETFVLGPDMFSSYIAIDPSLWWNNAGLLKSTGDRLDTAPGDRKSVFLASSKDAADLTAQLATVFDARRAGGINFHYAALTGETHATVYHPAALLALRTVFAPLPAAAK
jgi:uncharacterized protein